MPLVALAAAASGAAFGVAADRIAARWPAHRDADGSVDERPTAMTDATAAARAPAHAMLRRADWRTIAVASLAAAAAAGLLARWSDPRDIVVLGVYFAALVVLTATDLDQKILPDVITLPLIGYALVMLLVGWDPLLAGKSMGLVSGVAAGIGAPVLLLVTDRLLGGNLGMGDVKLAVALGLMSGVSLLFAGFLIASAASSVVLIALIATRRLGLRSPIPFGPILIAGGFIAALLP
jgi:leader peptidase (prepilin peptidase)/N-methyltransferase